MSQLNRNDFCWCGSGLKYKKCHMDSDAKLLEFAKQGYKVLHPSLYKTEEQIEKIRRSGDITRGALDYVSSNIKAGVTTEEINTWVHNYITERGGIPATLNYSGFPKSCCTSLNDVICHGIPDNTVLKDGDIINVDVTTILDGFYADASRMYKIGDVSERASKIVDVAKECLEAGLKAVKPYASVFDIGRAIEPIAIKNGYSIVRDFGGHGVGVKFHEDPHVDHYARRGKGVLLVPGMVFTIEPMVNEGTFECEILEDDWTTVTADGGLSAQWEHTLVVTEDGYEILT